MRVEGLGRRSIWRLARSPEGRPLKGAGTGRAADEEVRRIERTGIEMLEAWYGADADRLERVLHPDLAKRGVLLDEEGRTQLVHMGKEEFVARTRAKRGLLPEEEWQLHAEVLDTGGDIATVKVTSQYLVDVCQVMKVGGEWRIVNVLWYARKTPPWFES